MENIAIIGAGGLGREVLGIINSINRQKPRWNVVGFYDDGCTEKEVNGIPVLGGLSELSSGIEKLSVVVAIGNPVVKKSIVAKLSRTKLNFPIVVHPSVVIYDPEFVSLSPGVVIGANTVLTTNISINSFAYINTAVVLAHDVSVGAYTMLMPSVTISAGAQIGELVYIGNSVKIDQPISIPNGLSIPLGTVIQNQNCLEKISN